MWLESFVDSVVVVRPFRALLTLGSAPWGDICKVCILWEKVTGKGDLSFTQTKYVGGKNLKVCTYSYCGKNRENSNSGGGKKIGNI